MSIPGELRMFEKPLLHGFWSREEPLLKILRAGLVLTEVDTGHESIYIDFASTSEGKGDRGFGAEVSLLSIPHFLDEEQKAVGGVLSEGDGNTASHTRRRLSALRAEGVRRLGLPARNAEGHA
jgi:hypothetical protein